MSRNEIYTTEQGGASKKQYFTMAKANRGPDGLKAAFLHCRLAFCYFW
jgi:hypothetical protein